MKRELIYDVLTKATIVLSGSLLFIVEPFIGKFILPYFGGGSGVWSICLLFFTFLLLAGYGYGHFISQMSFRSGLRLHIAVLVISGIAILLEWGAFGTPLLPDNTASFVDSIADIPSLSILFLLAVAIGFPFFLLSTTSTMIQLWAARVDISVEPYRLYRISNFAALFGLLIYPLVLEHFFTLHELAWIWGVFFFMYVVGYITLAHLTQQCATHVDKSAIPPDTAAQQVSVTPWKFARWMFYAGLPASMLVSITASLTRDIAPIPFLWIIPLALYLISYARAFGSQGLTSRFVQLTVFFGLWSIFLPTLLNDEPLLLAIFFLCVFFFIMHLCHVLLYLDRPPSTKLATFYFAIAIGGALGTLFSALAVPVIFPYPIEYELLIIVGLAVAILHIQFPGWVTKNMRKFFVFGIPTLLLVVIYYSVLLNLSETKVTVRNFFGAMTVKIQNIPERGNFLTLSNGVITHGAQFEDTKFANFPTTYYSQTSGIGRALLEKQRLAGNSGISVGVVGLGVGTVVAYCRPNDEFTLYEINPLNVTIAKEYFTFLDGCEKKEIVLGDARLSMENAIRNGEKPTYDVLIIDAFNGDAIPVHLLTAEAFAIYKQLLRDDSSMLLVHISNRYLNLKPIVFAGGASVGLDSAYIGDIPAGLKDGMNKDGAMVSNWVLLGASDAVFARIDAKRVSASDSDFHTKAKLWTDDYSNLLAQLRFWRAKE